MRDLMISSIEVSIGVIYFHNLPLSLPAVGAEVVASTGAGNNKILLRCRQVASQNHFFNLPSKRKTISSVDVPTRNPQYLNPNSIHMQLSFLEQVIL